MSGKQWRVQWISRAAVGEPDREEKADDFTTEAEARNHLNSDEVQSQVGPYRRVELRRLVWETVETGDYGTVKVPK